MPPVAMTSIFDRPSLVYPCLSKVASDSDGSATNLEGIVDGKLSDKGRQKYKQTYKAVFDQSSLVVVGDTSAATAQDTRCVGQRGDRC